MLLKHDAAKSGVSFQFGFIYVFQFRVYVCMRLVCVNCVFSYISRCSPTMFLEVGLFFLRCVSCARRIGSSCHFVSLTVASCFFCGAFGLLLCVFVCLFAWSCYQYAVLQLPYLLFLLFCLSLLLCFVLSFCPSFLSCLLVSLFPAFFLPAFGFSFFFFCVCFRKAVLHVLLQAFLLLFSFSFIFLSLFPFLSVASFVFVF